MDAFPSNVVSTLPLKASVEAEAKAVRNLLPTEPWAAPVLAGRDEIADWIRAEWERGRTNLRSLSVNVRKAGHGIRPVPIMGIAERVTYRALSTQLLKDLDVGDRSAVAYKAFLQGPIDFGLSVGAPPHFRTFSSAVFGYVLEADVSAFYEYVDHETLREEIQLQTGEVALTQLLVQLLNESEGRTFGIPQLLDASDWLSEFYIRVVERDLVRQGLTLWRYNDDFRIGCRDYGQALDAIEKLEEAARAVGLTISEHKTRTPSFMNYFIKNTGVEVSDELATIDPQDVEIVVRAYVHGDDDEAIDDAAGQFGRLELDGANERRIDLKSIRGDEIADLRAALATLTRNADPLGLRWVTPLFEYVASLTPRLVLYLMSLQRAGITAAKDRLDSLQAIPWISEWQALWLVHAYRELGLVGQGEVVPWLQAQRLRGAGRLLGAEAALSLATVGAISFRELDQATRMEPAVLAPWFVLGIRALGSSPSPPSASQLDAVKNSSPLFRVLLEN